MQDCWCKVVANNLRLIINYLRNCEGNVCPQDIISSGITPYTSLFKSDENFLITFRGLDCYLFSQDKQLSSQNTDCHQWALQFGTEKRYAVDIIIVPRLYCCLTKCLFKLLVHFMDYISVYTDILHCIYLSGNWNKLTLSVKGLLRHMFNLFQILFLLFPVLQGFFINIKQCDTFCSSHHIEQFLRTLLYHPANYSFCHSLKRIL